MPATTTLTVLGGSVAAPSSPALPAPVVAYQWYRGDVAIVGATKASYKLSAADAAKQVWVRVTVSKPTHTTVVKTSPRVDYTVMQDSMPTLASTAWRVGVDAGVTGQSYLTKDGVLASPVLAYQWLRNSVLIAGATQATHPIVAADYNTRLALRITASSPGYLPLVFTTATSPLITKGVTTGTPDVQVVMTSPATGTLTASLVPGTLDPAGPAPVLAYKWYRANPATPGTRVLIAGATASA